MTEPTIERSPSGRGVALKDTDPEPERNAHEECDKHAGTEE